MAAYGYFSAVVEFAGSAEQLYLPKHALQGFCSHWLFLCMNESVNTEVMSVFVVQKINFTNDLKHFEDIAKAFFDKDIV